MADLKYYDVILRPIVTEKSMNSMSDKSTHLQFIRMLPSHRSRKQLRRCLPEQRLRRLTR